MIDSSSQFKHSELTEKVIRVFYEVYNELGYGFLESVYHNAMTIALAESGLSVENEVATPVWFRRRLAGDFRADIVVNGLVLIEQKSAKSLEASHEAQTLNYLRATSIEIALILNFGPKPKFIRLAYDNERKKIRVHPRSSAAAGL
jgi:GxxExxY protein